MARTKQVPLRREVSSEYTSKHDRDVNGNSNGLAPQPSGAVEVKSKGKGVSAPAVAVARKEGSVVTLLIDVAGIYISL